MVARDSYFPERPRTRRLALHRLPSSVYALVRAGVQPLRAASRSLLDHLGGVDAVLLVDGGTDILMRGDETGLGTPEDDMARLAAVVHAQEATRDHPGIVNGSTAAAVRGDFGNVQFTTRIRHSELFINPLMSVYFCVDAPGLTARNLYLDRLEATVLTRQISTLIEEFRDELPRQRPGRVILH